MAFRYLSFAAIFMCSFGVQAQSAVAYPQNFREWAHVHSGVVETKESPLYGFHHVYVDSKTLVHYKAGKKLPEGAQFAVPFYEITKADGAITQGPLKLVAVMKKNKKQTATGGWEYAAFTADGKNAQVDVVTACFQCHQSRKDNDFIFSSW